MKNTFNFLLCFLLVCSCKAQEIPQVDWEALQKTKPWTATEQWEPVPEKVTPGVITAPPSDAIILFDGIRRCGVGITRSNFFRNWIPHLRDFWFKA